MNRKELRPLRFSRPVLDVEGIDPMTLWHWTFRAVAAIVFLTTAGVAGSAAEPPARPNILILLTDDQRWDAMGCAGNRIVQTPQMDRLASEGTWFVNAFVTSSICAASRASIFTGQYERSHRCNFHTGCLRRA